MKILFIGGLFPDNNFQEILSNSKGGGLQLAADALQKSIIEGLSVNSKQLAVLNLPFIGPWPLRYKRLLSPSSFNIPIKTHNGHYTLHNRRFITLYGYRYIDRFYRTKKIIRSFCSKHNKEIIYIIVYSLSTPFLKAALDIKKTHENTRVLAIAPDLPEYMSSARCNIFRKILKRLDQFIQTKLYEKIDGFVVLADAMKERLIKFDQPYVVVEGIFNDSDDNVLTTKKEGSKVILYSGSTARRYNVMDLVYAVSKLKRHDFVLEIYGDGDAKSEIKQISQNDHRIKYCGIRSRSDILKRQKEAFLLVNPRNSEGEYTKYSFPSKTMEYLASGTPTLIHKLPGIPDEYYQYCFLISENNIESLSDSIDKILDMDLNSLRIKGEEAKKFILSQKNPYIQTQKIMDLIEKIEAHHS